MPKTIYVTVRYDEKLQKITHAAESPVALFHDRSFPHLLMNVFIEHPEIDRGYKPGQLGFLVNGIPPTTQTILQEGDIVELSAHIN